MKELVLNLSHALCLVQDVRLWGMRMVDLWTSFSLGLWTGPLEWLGAFGALRDLVLS